MTGDMRVVLAREYLDGARSRPLEQLPPMLLLRECAELRRIAGQLLDIIGHQVATLTEAQHLIVLSALADAAVYRTERAAAWCGECETAPEGACREHVSDLDDADAYRALAREIGGGR